MPRASVCPNCGQPVSTFAAGCALCGADLEAHRAQLRARPPLLSRVAARRPRARHIQADATDLAMLSVPLLLALFSPLFGLLLAAFCAWAKHRDGDLAMRNILIGLGALALVGMFFPLAVL
jgi:predicted amidophosphoribosyltransferase